MRWRNRLLAFLFLMNSRLVLVQSFHPQHPGKKTESVISRDWRRRIGPQTSRYHSAIYVVPPPGIEQTQYDACIDFMENHEQEQEALLKRDSKIYMVPIVVAILSYTLFPETQQIFHSTLTALSLGGYSGELSEDIRPLINGPVTLTISILFGSLVSMTIGTLYGRQTDIHR